MAAPVFSFTSPFHKTAGKLNRHVPVSTSVRDFGTQYQSTHHRGIRLLYCRRNVEPYMVWLHESVDALAYVYPLFWHRDIKSNSSLSDDCLLLFDSYFQRLIVTSTGVYFGTDLSGSRCNCRPCLVKDKFRWRTRRRVTCSHSTFIHAA